MIWNDLAENRARARVSASLKRGADGVPYIEMNAALRKQVKHNPYLKYAVFDLDQTMAFRGSSPELVALLGRILHEFHARQCTGSRFAWRLDQGR